MSCVKFCNGFGSFEELLIDFGNALNVSSLCVSAKFWIKYAILQKWAQTTLYQKRGTIKRNNLFNQQNAAQNVQFNFLISEAQRNFRNELFNSVEAQRNSAIAERHFRVKSRRNLTSAIEISQRNANTAFFEILGRKKANNWLKKADVYQYYDRNGTALSSMYRIALLTEKKIESSTQLKRNKF